MYPSNCIWTLRILLTISWQEVSFSSPSGIFQITMLFLCERFSRSSSFFSKVATRALSALTLKFSFIFSTSLFVNSRPCFTSFNSLFKLAEVDSSSLSWAYKTSWRLSLSLPTVNCRFYRPEIFTKRLSSSKVLSAIISSCTLLLFLNVEFYSCSPENFNFRSGARNGTTSHFESHAHFDNIHYISTKGNGAMLPANVGQWPPLLICLHCTL